MKLSDRGQIQLWDGLRSFFDGVRLPLRESVAMLILIEYFDASNLLKTCLPVVSALGLLFAMPANNLVRRSGWPINRVLATVSILACLALLGAGATSIAVLFVVLVALPDVLSSPVLPLTVHIYSGYEKELRGKRYATSGVAIYLGALAFGWCAGQMLGAGIELFREVLLLFAAAFAPAALAGGRLPKTVLPQSGTRRLWADFTLLKEDPLFAYVCLTFFIHGTAVLWLAPYRANLLAEKDFGFSYAPGLIILIVSVLPGIVRSICLPLGGILFDRIGFVALRIIVSVMFAVYVLLFFYGGTMWAHIAGMVVLGMTLSANTVNWMLWVTQLAPPEKTSAYMAVHTSLTGLRLLLAPLMGLWALKYAGPHLCAVLSAVVMLGAALMLVPVFRHKRTRFKH